MAYKSIELTAQQTSKWADTRTALLWHQPAFSHIFYTLLQNHNGRRDMAIFTKEVPIAATDGENLILNPETFFEMPLNQRVFVTSHEILHCILNHCVQGHALQRRGKVNYPDGGSVPYDHDIMNAALDYVVNAILVESKVGEMPKVGLYDPNIATSKDAALDIYRKLYKQQQGKGGGGGKGQGFDQHLAPGTSTGKDPATAAAGRNQAQWDTEIKSAMHAAKVQGKLPAGMERLLDEVLEPAVDWREKIRGVFARKIGSGSWDWRRPDRRLITRDIYTAGRSGYGAGDVVVAVDTSGSIGQKELDMFFAEMAGILEDVKPKRLIVMWCDAKVHRVDELEESTDLFSLRSKGAPGGGGTSFKPVFEEVKNMGLNPEVVVYLTDGYGAFPEKELPYPVIWGNISPPNSVKYPFGDVVDIPKQAA